MTQSDEKVRNLQLRRTWIEEEVEEVQALDTHATADAAFQTLAASLLFDIGYGDLDPSEIVDGGQDKQIDVIRIIDDETKSFTHIHIIQAKHQSGFGSNTLIQMRNGLNWIFGKPMADVQTLTNERLKNKIVEIRDIRRNYGSAGLNISVYYVSMGDSEDLAQEYIQERSTLINEFSNLGFYDFKMFEIGAFDLVNLLNSNQQRSRQIDVDMHLVYDVNRNSIMEYGVGDTQALICTVTGEELARIAQSEPKDAIFDMNVRPYYGDRGKVNSEIKDSCTQDNSSRFWFLNNGITMTCDKFDIVRDPDNPIVKIKNAQIVNGCQTTVTLRDSYESGELKSDVKVMVRIYATDNKKLVDKITLTTNNQNSITDRDLRANDDVQRDIQSRIESKYDYYYERKNKEFKNLNRQQRSRIIPNTKAAQAYLAIVRRKPSVARGYLARIWSDHYSEIFTNATIEDLIACYKIHNYCFQQAKEASNDQTTPPVESQVAVYGTYHLARIIGYHLRKDLWGSKYQDEISNLIEELDDGEILSKAYEEAFSILVKIRRETVESSPNPALYFKATGVERAVERVLRADDE